MNIPTTLPEPSTTSYTFEYEFKDNPFMATTYEGDEIAVSTVRVTIAVNLDEIKLWESVYATGYIGNRRALSVVMTVEFDQQFLADARLRVAQAVVS